MGYPPEITRIRAEDFKPEEQEIVGKLAAPLNRFFEQVIDLFNKNIDYTNLNKQFIQVNVQIDGLGMVINPPQAKFTLRSGKVLGVVVLAATNINSPGVYPITAPFISYTTDKNILTIVNVSGLQMNSNYTLSLELTG